MLFRKIKTHQWMQAFVVSMAVILSVGAYASKRDERITINLGLNTTSKPSAMVRKFRPIVSELEKRVSEKLGEPVRIRMQIAKDNKQAIANISNGKADFSRFGPATYVDAKATNPDIQILAIESKNKTKIAHGIIATGLHSSIQSLQDLKGQSFAFGDEQSTSGRYFAQQYLLEHGIAAKELGRYAYLGRHDIVGTKVGVGDYAAGAMSETTFRKLLADGEKIRELARFPIVSTPWVARAGIDPKIYGALKLSLLEMTHKKALLPLDINGFLEGTNNDYTIVAKSISNNFKFFVGDDRDPVDWVLAAQKEKKRKAVVSAN